MEAVLISYLKYDLIEQHNCGITRNILNADDYAMNLKEMVEMNQEEYDLLCDNAIKAAKDYDYKKLTGQLIDIIERLLI